MKTIVISIIIAAGLIGGAMILSSAPDSTSPNIGTAPVTTKAVNNVSIVDGKQIITINAKGGYFPAVTTAKAGIPTVIKMESRATFDCSSALVIPDLQYRKNLPPSGETLIPVPPQEAGSTLRGLCAMGMYNFVVNFN